MRLMSETSKDLGDDLVCLIKDLMNIDHQDYNLLKIDGINMLLKAYNM